MGVSLLATTHVQQSAPHHFQQQCSLLPEAADKQQQRHFGSISSSTAAYSKQLILAVGSCVLYMSSAASLILLNSHILSKEGFRYPITLSLLGMSFSSVASHVYCSATGMQPAEPPTITEIGKFLFVGLVMAGGQIAGNAVYLSGLSVAFIQMLKALSPVATMSLLFATRLEAPTRRLVAAVLVITAGVVTASFGEGNFVPYGFALMAASIMADACRYVSIQFLLVSKKMHPMECLKYLAPACSVWLLLGMLVFEYQRMLGSGAFLLVASRPWLYCLAGCMGFVVNGLCYASIKLTSSLTIKLLATVKDAVVVLLSVALLGNTVAPMQGLGYTVALLGFGAYCQALHRRTAAQGGGSGGPCGRGESGGGPLLCRSPSRAGEKTLFLESSGSRSMAAVGEGLPLRLHQSQPRAAESGGSGDAAGGGGGAAADAVGGNATRPIRMHRRAWSSGS